ncbi:uncharacterized protein LOC6582992 [Drosophila mojavensis]|uniref:Uncharacterized protein n=1 Tax=Drosophila mojavensis TaxID=7230 RepID=B4L0I0_DROMO|nr:uncharacterized protein LOC6582992 [Drosophila mojavensis]EDW19149.1 uncharacterized protein Dmoj_GI13624 [Drosophila mojavensis]
MSKVLIFLAFFCLCLMQIQAQPNENRRICEKLNRDCVACQRRRGPDDDVTNIFNANCRRSDRRWKNITRCELDRATCELTLGSCRAVTCANVRRIIN